MVQKANRDPRVAIRTPSMTWSNGLAASIAAERPLWSPPESVFGPAAPLCGEECKWDVVIATMSLARHEPNWSQAAPSAVLIVLDPLDDPRLSGELLCRGAAACVPEDCEGARLVGVIEEVLEGGMVLERSIFQQLLKPTPILSARQRKILEALARGDSTSAIATELSLSDVTVRSHIRRLAVRFDCDGRNQLQAMAPALLREDQNADTSGIRPQTR